MNRKIPNIIKLVTSSFSDKKLAAQTQEHNAWWLIEHITGKKKEELLAHDDTLSHEHREKLAAYVHEMVHEHKPLQYIIGTIPFCDITIITEPPTLIPRPETEEWCSRLQDELQSIKGHHITILDLCTGSGALALSLAHTFPHFEVLGVELDNDAFQLARKNKNLLNLKNCTFIQSDLYGQIPCEKKFDLIISNPPYVTVDEWKHMPPHITQWESEKAFVAGDEGLDLYKRIIKDAKNYLKHDSILQDMNLPRIVLEIGSIQAHAVSTLLTIHHFSKIEIHKDLSGKDRVMYGFI